MDLQIPIEKMDGLEDGLYGIIFYPNSALGLPNHQEFSNLELAIPRLRLKQEVGAGTGPFHYHHSGDSDKCEGVHVWKRKAPKDFPDWDVKEWANIPFQIG